jgi:hypothetical protein
MSNENETTTEQPADSAPAAKVEKPKKVSKPKQKPVAVKKAAVKKAPAKKAPAKKAKAPTKAKPAKGKVVAKGSSRGKGPANLRNKLHKLFLEKMPKKYQLDASSINFEAVSKDVKMSVEGVYKWFRNDSITPAGAMLLTGISAGKLKLVDLHPFVFKK